MEETRKDLLEKVEPDRRDFLKKLAIGTAYAVPVMASFSLDSVRNKAFAQASYGAPRVAWLAALAANQGVRIMFDQPMNTGIGKSVAGRNARDSVCYNRQACFMDSSGQCVNLPHEWSWESDQAQLLTISGSHCGKVNIQYGMKPPAEGCIDFTGANGLTLVPYEGEIYICWD